MKKFPYKVSVIIPVYNAEPFLEKCLDSLLSQTIPTEEMEVLLIDDGSLDHSFEICKEYAQKYPMFHVFHLENGGPAKARNFGIDRAAGKYIAYLDSDDTLAPETLRCVTEFFDGHYDEVDLVTYKIVSYQNGKAKKLHYRYKFLPQSGVYDLTQGNNIFISQTTMNVCVKNLGEKNIHFDVSTQSIHEDEKYNINVLQSKWKIGYCDQGEYQYIQNQNSIVSTLFHAYYIFEINMSLWEKIFGEYGDKDIPRYIQVLYLNDLYWKLKSDILFPYHYDKDKFDQAVARIVRLLKKVDDDVILLFPGMNSYHATYFLRMKDASNIRLITGSRYLGLVKENHLLFADQRITLLIRKLRIRQGKIHITGVLKSPIFDFVDDAKLYLIKNKNYLQKEEVPLMDSSWGYFLTKVKTNQLWSFVLEIPHADLTNLSFEAFINHQFFLIRLEFAVGLSICPGFERNVWYQDGIAFTFKRGSHEFAIEPENSREKKKYWRKLQSYNYLHGRRYLLFREFYHRFVSQKRKVWLYYDCSGVRRDNGYYQFIHDFSKNDGIERYYIYNDDIDRSDLFTKVQKKHLVRFKSQKHKILFLSADKIITAFIEQINYNPLNKKEKIRYGDLIHYDLIYLQHGVLHAHLPWKYSLDRLLVDKEVISTKFEHDNLINNYGFSDKHLIPSGMPRYDHIDRKASPKKRILFAPSWRKYLVGMKPDGTWFSLDKKFQNSLFYQETNAFLKSNKLEELLEKFDFHLDFKLHPIFERYKNFYTVNDDRIHIANSSVNEFEYQIFITDFSSFLFDFAYLQRPLFYFVPDRTMFRSGMNDYRELDMPLEDGLGPLTFTASEALTALQRLLENGCQTEKIYAEKMADLFYEVDDHEEMIYQTLIQDDETEESP